MPVVFPAPFRRRQNDDEPLRLMEMCTHLITGNEHLRETSAPYASSVSTIPTVIDCRRYGLIHSHTSGDDGDARCVVWCGQSSTLPYLIDALDPIREAADRLAPLTFRLRVICDDVSALESEDLGPVTLEGIRWSELREVQDLLGAHVGIMPLPDDEWTRGKCGFKLLQYMALGIPAIASPVGVNATIVTDRVNGCLAATDEEWVEALVRLLSDKALRMALGCKARETVRERFSLQQYAADFVRIVSGGAP